MPLLRLFLLTTAALVTQPALAQQNADDSPVVEETVDGDEILVVATRIRGQVDAGVPPIMTLDPEDIATYGASSIGELLEAVSPQTSSGRGRGGGRPVVLLNGQRISGFRQLRNIPPEAIRRMEVLPEEVALRFGYPPDQRVVNFILKENFSSFQVAGEYNVPTRGGFAESELEASWSNFDGPRRLNLHWKGEDTSLLTEAERDIVQPVGSAPEVAGDFGPGETRSLIADAITHTFDGSWSTGLGEEGMGGTFTIDGEASRSDARSLSGVGLLTLTAPDGISARRSFGAPLEREVRTDALEGGLTLNKPLGAWQLTGTVDANYTDTATRIDRRFDPAPILDAVAAGALAVDGALPTLADPGRDLAQSQLLTIASFASLAGSPLTLPAGETSLTVNVGYDYLDLDSEDTRSDIGPLSLSRNIYSTGANLALPVTSRRNAFGAPLGDLTLNLSAAAHHFSDFGTLGDWSAGVIWSPAEKLTLNASYIVSEVAPSVGQLGNPAVENFNVPVFDFTTGQDALVTVITGGNPFLLAEKQKDIKLSATYELDWFRRSSVMVEYFRNRSDNVTRSFPLLTPAIEAAFADRVTRDAAGNLLAIDRRPVTFDNVASERMRWGLNLSGRLEPEAERSERGRGARGGERPGFGRGGPPGGRWNVSLYHTWRFTDRVSIAPGVPIFDQLAGDALVDGGVPRHSLELEGGVFHKGYGLRISGDWMSSATVRSLGAPGVSDLRFGSVLNLDARIFVNFGQRERLVERMPFLKGLRLAFTIDNILDSRQLVTDADGETPFAYQKAFRDPRGRFVGIDLRKTF